MLTEELVLVQCKRACLLWNQTKLQCTFGCDREITGSAVLDNELFVSERGLCLSWPDKYFDTLPVNFQPPAGSEEAMMSASSVHLAGASQSVLK